MYRNHIILCCCLVLLAIPVYIVDTQSLKGNGPDWISLNLQGLFIRPYLFFLLVHIVLSTLAVSYVRHTTLRTIHFSSALLAIVLLAAGFMVYDKMTTHMAQHKHRTQQESRKALLHDIELKSWWFVPDETAPRAIQVDLLVAAPGRFAAYMVGADTEKQGTVVFSSNGEAQRTVRAGERFTYKFPVEKINPGHADSIEIICYLFKAPLGTSSDKDVSKIFKAAPLTDDDGSYFYGTLPPPSLQKAP